MFTADASGDILRAREGIPEDAGSMNDSGKRRWATAK